MQPPKVILYVGGASRTEQQEMRLAIDQELIEQLALEIGEFVGRTHPLFQKLLELFPVEFPVAFYSLTPVWEKDA
jgi:hypothetical protein